MEVFLSPTTGTPSLPGASDAEQSTPPDPHGTVTLPPTQEQRTEFAARDVPSGFGDYEVLGELGRGGMGIVYKARHTPLKRLVALKVILAGVHAKPEHFARFQREAEAVARLSHPNIVQVYEVGEHNGLPYCALEYVEGQSLAHRLGTGPLGADEAARLVEILARAVHHAHERNVVHRDIKPGNVLLTKAGVPKLTDFGVSKVLDAPLTEMEGAVLGTPTYMAPEQAAGRTQEIGPAADVYALGAILYELLTGRPPFQADFALDTLVQVLDRDPLPPHHLRPKLPCDLAASRSGTREVGCPRNSNKEAGLLVSRSEKWAQVELSRQLR